VTLDWADQHQDGIALSQKASFGDLGRALSMLRSNRRSGSSFEVTRMEH
jgi:hypothetical protein